VGSAPTSMRRCPRPIAGHFALVARQPPKTSSVVVPAAVVTSAVTLRTPECASVAAIETSRTRSSATKWPSRRLSAGGGETRGAARSTLTVQRSTRLVCPDRSRAVAVNVLVPDGSAPIPARSRVDGAGAVGHWRPAALASRPSRSQATVRLTIVRVPPGPVARSA